MNRSTGSSAKQAWNSFAIAGIFAVAMGFLEAIVVVYLREIYYPEGFTFPLVLLPQKMASIEWIREFATLIMLLAIGIMSGKNLLQKLLFFLYSFAVWDIIYYVALYLFLDWPPSLLTWDLLFLIPVPWISPVIAPVICSLTMILMALTIIIPQEKGKHVKIRLYEWLLIFGGAFVILFTFVRDYIRLLTQSGSAAISVADKAARTEELLTSFIPSEYSWIIFCLGEALILIALFIVLRRIYRS